MVDLVKYVVKIKKYVRMISTVVLRILFVSRNILSSDVLSRDVLSRDVLSRDVLSRDILYRDVLSRYVLSRDMLSRHVLSRDVLSRDVLSRDVLSRDSVFFCSRSTLSVKVTWTCTSCCWTGLLSTVSLVSHLHRSVKSTALTVTLVFCLLFCFG